MPGPGAGRGAEHRGTAEDLHLGIVRTAGLALGLVLNIAGCASAAPSAEPSSAAPALSIAPSPTARISHRPVPPAGLTVTGADAPRNVPDPCAVLTAAELEALLGIEPELAVRSFDGTDDSWSCSIEPVGDGTTSVLIGVSVNAAYPGWATELEAAGGGHVLDHPTLDGVEFTDGGIAVALGSDVLLLVGSTAEAIIPAEPLLEAAAAAAERNAAGG